MEKIKVTLDWFANTNHAGFLLAEKKGYFKEAGLDVKIHGDVHGDIEVGESDIIVSPQPALLKAMKQGEKIVAIATLTQSSDSGIVSLKESGITSPKKLEGKRLTHWSPAWFHGILSKALVTDGGDYDKVVKVPMDVANIVETLGKDADATWVYENWENYVLLEEGKEINFFNFADVDPLWNFCAPAVAASCNMIENRKNVLIAFMKAVARGYEKAAANPENTIREIKDLLPEASEKMLVNSLKHLSGKFLTEDGKWGYIDPNRWNPFANWMVKEGYLDCRRDVEFTNEFN